MKVLFNELSCHSADQIRKDLALDRQLCLFSSEARPAVSMFVFFVAISGSIREEDGVRWHGCPYCSKEFKKPSDLVRHIRIHTHEKPFKCKQCFRAFAVKSTLTAHMKTHTGVKAFECQSCLKCFSTSGSMKVHMRLHTGEIHFHWKTCATLEVKFRIWVKSFVDWICPHLLKKILSLWSTEYFLFS